ncbi:MAG: coagulation factor 5/8 type domain-containing protein [Gluconacetobacter diazotrophicus]|nr:coagulation factor 5/8 type domain-containing protein [Gluconacetobacter diazotrophicus]
MELARMRHGAVRVGTRALLLGCSVLALSSVAANAADPSFGPNVTILDPGMSAAAVQGALNAASQEAQFSSNRTAILFKPGTYNVDAQLGYYEAVAGLGATPGGVVINGGLRAEAPLDPGGNTDNATQVFWRSEENVTIAPTGGSTRWAVSQGCAFRRMHIEGQISLAGAKYGWASGGFIADSLFDGQVGPYSQQQWYTRNSVLNGWTNAVWNMVFSGVTGAPAQSFPNPPYTTLAATPVSREKPFLFVDGSGNWNVFSPAARRNSSGIDWSGGLPAGRTLPIARFFIAQPSTPVASINQALSSGLNLILTPGIYRYSSAIHVTAADTVVLGLGYATLVPQNGNAALLVDDVGGVQLAGLLVDAGPVNSPVLVQLGGSGAGTSHSADPGSVSDVFFRIGGATAGSATTSLAVNSDDVILDNIWAWRADHGNGIGWTNNTAAHGLTVAGDRVTALGLAVEHYQQNQVLWQGQNGETVFYQSELPYDVPSQAAWKNGNANGYASYAVGGGVTSHQAYGLGVYSYFDQGVAITEDSAISVPNASGVAIHDAATVLLNGSGQITHIVNGSGAAARTAGQEETLNSYP